MNNDKIPNRNEEREPTFNLRGVILITVVVFDLHPLQLSCRLVEGCTMALV
jgi:hypothetical protein